MAFPIKTLVTTCTIALAAMMCPAAPDAVAPESSPPNEDGAQAPARRADAGSPTPLAAARRAMLALADADREELRQSLWTGTEPEREAADVWVALSVGQVRLTNAVRDRFGPEGVEQVIGSRDQRFPTGRGAAAAAEAMLKTAEVKVEGEYAVLTHPSDTRHPIMLRKTEAGWKVAFASFFALRDPEKVARFVRNNRAVGPACVSVAAQVERGAFKKPDDVVEALYKGIAAAQAREARQPGEGPPPPRPDPQP